MATITLTTTAKRFMAEKFKDIMKNQYKYAGSGAGLSKGQTKAYSALYADVNEFANGATDFSFLEAKFSLGASPSSTVKLANKIAIGGYFNGNYEPLIFQIHKKIKDIYFFKKTGSGSNATYTVGAIYETRNDVKTISNDDTQEVIYIQKFEVSF